VRDRAGDSADLTPLSIDALRSIAKPAATRPPRATPYRILAFASASESRMYRKLILLLCALATQGCTTAMVVGAVVGTAATVAVETAKVPVKATGAVVDVITDDDEDDE
jgi:hypothetical protein